MKQFILDALDWLWYQLGERQILGHSLLGWLIGLGLTGGLVYLVVDQLFFAGEYSSPCDYEIWGEDCPDPEDFP